MWRGESSFAEMTMEIRTEHWKRSIEMRAWSYGKDYSLIIITYPPKERGVATLKVDKDIWNYLPRVNRVIRVPSSMMMAEWMGSHFTNDDLVKESRMSEDYETEISFDGKRDGMDIYDIVLVPRPDAPVVWGKIEISVIKDELIPIASRYYDEDGQLARTMVFEDVRLLGGRKIPATMVLIPEDKPDERTVIRYNSMEFGLGLDESFFSRKNLTRKDLIR
jgi:outer membrane lipoprotein-sorting protein